MQVCHFFATSGCRQSAATGCTSGAHDASLVFPYLQSIVCPICVQHGACTAKGCTKQHSPQVVNRYRQELANQASAKSARSTPSHATPLPAKTRPVSAQPLPPCTTLVHLPKTRPDVCASALVAKMQGMGFAPQSGQAKTTEEVSVEQTRRKTNVVVALDVSGSMRGRKLDNAKRELNKLSTLLENGDSLTIITFSNSVSIPMERRFKCQAKSSLKSKRSTQFDDADLRAVVASLDTDGGTALYDAVAAAMRLTQDAATKDMAEHPEAECNTYQLLIITDGEDNASTSATAKSVHKTLLHPGKWAGACHFSSCFVAIGKEAAAALAPCTTGLKHSVTVTDIDAGFRRLTETVAQIRTETVQKVAKSEFAWGGSAGGKARGA
jgi:Mg-chelatase subunit ChlD